VSAMGTGLCDCDCGTGSARSTPGCQLVSVWLLLVGVLRSSTWMSFGSSPSTMVMILSDHPEVVS
jgi:hypothetical protein